MSFQIEESAADRFESLGDNCEFGLVMRRFGFEHGGLFRWAFTEGISLLKLLQHNFEDFYTFENLHPNRPRMVEEQTYSIFWHSAMTVADVGGKLQFTQDENVRRELHAVEVKKIAYLKAKFLMRLRSGGIIYILKANCGIDPALKQAIFNELERLALGAKFWLVYVRTAEADEAAGTVRQIDEANMVALVKDFAPYTKANKIDIETWKHILAGILSLADYPDWDVSRSLVHSSLGSLD